MTAARIDKRPRCARCGGHDVEEIGWIAYRPDDAAREAGPELLAACRSAADVLAREGADGLRLALEALRQAIARAEGGAA